MLGAVPRASAARRALTPDKHVACGTRDAAPDSALLDTGPQPHSGTQDRTRHEEPRTAPGTTNSGPHPERGTRNQERRFVIVPSSTKGRPRGRRRGRCGASRRCAAACGRCRSPRRTGSRPRRTPEASARTAATATGRRSRTCCSSNAGVFRSSSYWLPLPRTRPATVRNRLGQVDAALNCTPGTCGTRLPASAGVAIESAVAAVGERRLRVDRHVGMRPPVAFDLDAAGANLVRVLADAGDQRRRRDERDVGDRAFERVDERCGTQRHRFRVKSTPPSKPVSVSGSSSTLGLVWMMPTRKPRCSSLSVGVRCAR